MVRRQRFQSCYAADAAGRRAWRHGLGRDPRLPAHPLQHQRDPGDLDAGLYRPAGAVLAGARALARPPGTELSAVAGLRRRRNHVGADQRHAGNLGHRLRPGAGGRRLGILAKDLCRISHAGGRAGARRGRLCRLFGKAQYLDRTDAVRRHRRSRRHLRSGRPDRTAAAADFPRLRVCRDHRRLDRTPASDRRRVRRAVDVAALSRRRVGADGDGPAVGDHRIVPGLAAVLSAGRRPVHHLPAETNRRARGRCLDAEACDHAGECLHESPGTDDCQHRGRSHAVDLRRARRNRGRKVRRPQSRHRRHDADRRSGRLCRHASIRQRYRRLHCRRWRRRRVVPGIRLSHASTCRPIRWQPDWR